MRKRKKEVVGEISKARLQPQIYLIQCQIHVPPDHWKGFDEFALAVREKLFDELGIISDFKGGFVCHPEDIGDPIIIVNTADKQICFEIVGLYEPKQAKEKLDFIIQGFCDEMKVNLRALKFEHYIYQKGRSPILVKGVDITNLSKLNLKDFSIMMNRAGHA